MTTERTYDNAWVRWIEYQGSFHDKKSRRAIEHIQQGCRVSVKHKTCTIETPDGHRFQKRIYANGFAFGQETDGGTDVPASIEEMVEESIDELTALDATGRMAWARDHGIDNSAEYLVFRTVLRQFGIEPNPDETDADED